MVGGGDRANRAAGAGGIWRRLCLLMFAGGWWTWESHQLANKGVPGWVPDREWRQKQPEDGRNQVHRGSAPLGHSTKIFSNPRDHDEIGRPRKWQGGDGFRLATTRSEANKSWSLKRARQLETSW